LSLKALVLGVNKRDLRQRLESGGFLGLTFISRRQYLGVKNQCDFFFQEETVNLRRSPKYSGYTKHYKDKGSLRPDIGIFIPDPNPTFENIPEKVLLEYLTVGKIPLFLGDGIPTLMRTKESETVQGLK
jgi:hypothetical protein